MRDKNPSINGVRPISVTNNTSRKSNHVYQSVKTTITHSEEPTPGLRQKSNYLQIDQPADVIQQHLNKLARYGGPVMDQKHRIDHQVSSSLGRVKPPHKHKRKINVSGVKISERMIKCPQIPSVYQYLQEQLYSKKNSENNSRKNSECNRHQIFKDS